MNAQVRTMRMGITILLAAYWLALFVATHIPRVPQELTLPGGDKWQHFVAYAGLAFLLAFRQSFGALLTWKRAAAVVGIVALYGVVDELSQIPVGRHADLLDWLADVIGASGGTALLAGLRGAISRLAPRQRRCAASDPPGHAGSL